MRRLREEGGKGRGRAMAGSVVGKEGGEGMGRGDGTLQARDERSLLLYVRQMQANS